MSVFEEEIPPGLIVYFREHNRRASLLAIGCLFGSALCWIAVYGAILWAELLFLTSTRGVDVPASISIRTPFLLAVALLFLVSFVVRRWEQRHEKFHLGRALVGLLSIPARLTLAIWDNLSARVHPSSAELSGSWLLLETLRTQKKIPATNLPALLTSSREASRVVYLLSITSLIDTDSYGGVYYHHLRNEQAERLVRRWTNALALAD